MKKLLLSIAVALIFISFDAHPIKIDRHMTGAWYNRNQDGHGFNIEVISETRSVFYWYVYNPDGTPTWLVGTGSNEDGRISGVAYHNTGMRWGVFDPTERTQERWGVVNIDFLDCNHATASYQSDDLSEQTIPFGWGSIDIERLTYVHKSKCAENPFPGIYRGYFWSNAAEQGFPGTVLLDGQGGFFGFSLGHRSFFGGHAVDGGNFIAEGSAYANDTGNVENIMFTAEGKIAVDYRLHTEYLIGGVDSGFADLYPVTQLYWRGITLAGLAGDYETQEMLTFQSGTASIGTNGTITGTDPAGCTWNGQISIPDAQFNMFNVDLTVSNCGDNNAFYEGTGFQDDMSELEDGTGVWFFSFSGPKALPVLMTRIVP